VDKVNSFPEGQDKKLVDIIRATIAYKRKQGDGLNPIATDSRLMEVYGGDPKFYESSVCGAGSTARWRGQTTGMGGLKMNLIFKAIDPLTIIGLVGYAGGFDAGHKKVAVKLAQLMVFTRFIGESTDWVKVVILPDAMDDTCDRIYREEPWRMLNNSDECCSDDKPDE
jgi:hypothetical protein